MEVTNCVLRLVVLRGKAYYKKAGGRKAFPLFLLNGAKAYIRLLASSLSSLRSPLTRLT